MSPRPAPAPPGIRAAGLALFLLIDRWASGWRERALGPDVPSPYVLLEEALEGA